MKLIENETVDVVKLLEKLPLEKVTVYFNLTFLSNDFVKKIVGSHLVRIRSQTVFYVLKRMKNACEHFLKTPHDL